MSRHILGEVCVGSFPRQTAFTGSEAISGAGGATANVSSIGNPEIEKHSGQVMYLENRAKVTRATAQIEDIKLVIEFQDIKHGRL